MNRGRLSGNGQRTNVDYGPLARPEPGREPTTGEALAAVARDTIDVAGELVRDTIALGRLEAERYVASLAPRVVWGVITFLCAATGGVIAIIAVMLALGAVIPSVAGRLAILAAFLFVVAFFGAVRFMRPGVRESVQPASTTESALTEQRGTEELLHSSPPGQPGRIVPPPRSSRSV
jgi:hypothetical protein